MLLVLLDLPFGGHAFTPISLSRRHAITVPPIVVRHDQDFDGMSSSSVLFATSKQCFLVLATAIPSFLLGTTVALYARLDNPQQTVACRADNLEAMLQARVAQAVAAEKAAWLDDCHGQQVADASKAQSQRNYWGNEIGHIKKV